MSHAAKKTISDVDISDLSKVEEHSGEISSKAMLLTDAWGAMFVMEEADLERAFEALGVGNQVVNGIYECSTELGYVRDRTSKASGKAVFTWHGAMPVLIALRGITDLSSAHSEISDTNVEEFVFNNRLLINRVSDALPSYTNGHMFSPDVAAQVHGVFGAKLSPSKIFELAERFGANTSIDLEGRRGVSSNFIRSLDFAMAATL